jgi:hypothetical protein
MTLRSFGTLALARFCPIRSLRSFLEHHVVFGFDGRVRQLSRNCLTCWGRARTVAKLHPAKTKRIHFLLYSLLYQLASPKGMSCHQ